MLAERLFKVFLRTEKDGGDLLPKVLEIDPTNIESAASIFKEHGQNIAGVVTEAVQGAGGVFLQTVSLRDFVACAMTTVLCSFLTKSLLDLEELGTGSLPTPTT